MAGATRTDEGPVLGAALALTLYGLVVVFFSAVLDREFVPSGSLLGLVVIAVLGGGALVGAAVDTAKARR